MTKQLIGNGKWFDPDKATLFEESRWFDGSNYISYATGTQWNHEELYRTAKNTWILHEWYDWQNGYEHWKVISLTDAEEWMANHGHSDGIEV